MTPETTQTRRRRIDKPFGVYVITFFDFLAVGVLPLLKYLILIRRPDSDLSFAAVFISPGLAASLMGACVWAGIGDNAGRWVLLVLITINCFVLMLDSMLTLRLDSGGYY